MASTRLGERRLVICYKDLDDPIGFAEPFGLSVVEAMTCGTPVIAYPKGSMREVVDVGVTGYLADNVSDAVGALDDALKLDRHQVRGRATERFSADRMAPMITDVPRRPPPVEAYAPAQADAAPSIMTGRGLY